MPLGACTPERIFKTQTEGLMVIQAAALTQLEQRAVALYLSEIPWGSVPSDDAPEVLARCESSPPLADDALDGAFLEGAEARGLVNLKGHRSVGGMRASLYNAVPEAAVDALIEYMQAFETQRSAG